MNTTLFCPDSTPNFLGFFDLSIAPDLLFYSYIPVIIVAIAIGIFVLIKDKYSFVSKLLFLVTVFYTLWTLNIFIAWIDAFHSHVMFSWMATPIIEVCMFVSAVYFTLVFINENKRDISFRKKILLYLMGFPIIFLLPFGFNISYFNSINCEGTPGMLWYYLYAFEIISIIWVILACLYRYKNMINDAEDRKHVIYTMIGMGSFLTLFLLSNVIGQYMQIQEISFLGSFGLVLFLGFLAYLIVRYHAFNIKLISAQALVFSLIVLVGSQFFFAQNLTSNVLTGVTLALVGGVGIALMRSVKQEVERKEELQLMADKLAQANDQLRKLDNAKTEFISIASHQLRTPLTAIKGFLSLVLEGSYGEVNKEVHGALDRTYSATERLIQLVEDLLNVSRIEAGRMEFKFEKADTQGLLEELYENFIMVSSKKKLSLELKKPKAVIPEILMDRSKIREVLSNIIDNAIKYTDKGGVTIRTELLREKAKSSRNALGVNVPSTEKGPEIEGDVVRITVSDTGIGIPAQEMPYLFKKFSRGKDISRLNAGGTGLGIYVGKSIMESHHGRIWVESKGAGMGSSFIVELPVSRVATS